MHKGVWIGVGLLVSILSFMLYEKLFLFFYIGIIFIIVGVIQVLIPETQPEKPKAPPKPHHPPRTISNYHKFCYRCGAVVRTTDQFCSACGIRLL